jgi:uncharacterized protein (UPF0210 family)
MEYTQAEILQTVAMTEMEHLDVRTVTLGLSLLDCSSDSMAGVAQKAGDKIRSVAARLVQTVDEIGDEFGIRVANKRISITPVSLITEGLQGDVIQVARAIARWYKKVRRDPRIDLSSRFLKRSRQPNVCVLR